MDEKSTWSPTRRTMDKVSWSPGIYVRPTSKRWAWRKFREIVVFLIYFFSMTYYGTYSRIDFKTDKHHREVQIGRVWDILYWTKSSPLFPSTKYAMVPQHGPFSLHTMLEGPWLPKTAFPTPMVRPLDESQGSSALQGHGSWLVCEVALSLL